ncbi:hypothetical protein [Jeotgalibacillus proteolyticus]|uniref:Uncharacterized protein n=1 Tax=Jeotgalibacillus proteolyticus TaxID=2082395 RepID=A0A2S5GCQ1_9BACL|nr:hypothetical protein [Jeotgalibacillus proteolyticus]PPA70684.1 hypothetical protein C4B60_07745 [Jeotgalibacillus proteolyticus]
MSLTVDQHRQEAIELFNKTWELLELQEKSSEQQLEMIRVAQASRYHWGIAGDYKNWSRGEWLISRVYAELGDGESALKYALVNEKLHTDYGLEDYDAAFVHEALARSYSILNKQDLKEFHLGKARGLAQGIDNQEDREYFFNELERLNE